VFDEGTRMEANESTFEGNRLNGVSVCKQASMQLNKCTAGSNKHHNVQAASGAVVSLTGCTVADSLEQSGLAVADEGARVEADESTFKGNCFNGVAVCKQASVQLDECTFQDNQQAKIANKNGTVVMNGERILNTS
jgi:ribonuclease I